MSGKTKNVISLLYSIVIIIFATLFTLVSVLPSLVLDIDEFNFTNEFKNGRYTSKIDMTEDVGIGLGTVVDIVKHFDDMVTVLNIQGLDQSIQLKEEQISKMSSESYSDEYIASEMQKLAEMIGDRSQALAELTEDDVKRIEDKLQNDRGFINVIGTIYGLLGAFTSDAEQMYAQYSELGISTLDITMLVLGIVLLISIIGVSLVFPIIILVKYLVFLIKSLAHLDDCNTAATDNRMDKFPFTTFTAMMLMFHMLYALVSTGVKIGGAVKGAVIIFIAVCLTRALKNILLAQNNRVRTIVKQAITCLSVVCAALLLVNFVGVDLINELDGCIGEASYKQYESELEALQGSGMDEYLMKETAQDAVSKSNGINTVIVVTLSLIGAMTIVVALINGVERFANKKMKLKTGQFVSYKAMISLGLFLAVLSVTPSLFAVDSQEALDEAYEQGRFKIWYTEYQEEGTKANIEYQLLKSVEQDGQEVVAELQTEIASAASEELAELEKELKIAERNLLQVKAQISDIEGKNTRVQLCIVSAVAFFICEIAYLIVSKKSPVKGEAEEDDGKAQTAEQEAPAPATEAPAPAAPAVEAPAPAAPAAEAPAPAAEAPAPAAPATEAPAPAAPVAEAPVAENTEPAPEAEEITPKTENQA